MNKLFLFFIFFSVKIYSQENKIIPEKFPTEFGTFTFPIGTKILLELKESENGRYDYRVLGMEIVDGFYSFKNDDVSFSKEVKKNTIELFFMGAYYNDGKEDKDYKTVLILRNNLDVPIIFKSDIKYYFSKDYEKTSIVNKYPKAKSTEIWQHKIDYITIFDFEKVKTKN